VASGFGRTCSVRKKSLMDDVHERGSEALSTMSEWAVYQCVNGCVHLRLEHLTLTFSAREFAQLVGLLGEAYVRLGVRAAVGTAGYH